MEAIQESFWAVDSSIFFSVVTVWECAEMGPMTVGWVHMALANLGSTLESLLSSPMNPWGLFILPPAATGSLPTSPSVWVGNRKRWSHFRCLLAISRIIKWFADTPEVQTHWGLYKITWFKPLMSLIRRGSLWDGACFCTGCTAGNALEKEKVETHKVFNYL